MTNEFSERNIDADDEIVLDGSDWQVDYPTEKWSYSCKYKCSTDVSTKSKDLPGAGDVVKA